jgi:hypothetical protein
MFGLDKYNYTSDRTFRVYSFLSNGSNGPIQKIAKFTEMGQNIFNFGFGDHDPVTNDISDTSVSNNQDTDVIMGTLGSIIYDFTNVFLEAAIFVQGTNKSRTRLYQMNINKHWSPSKKGLIMMHSWGAVRAPLSLLVINRLIAFQ